MSIIFITIVYDLPINFVSAELSVYQCYS